MNMQRKEANRNQRGSVIALVLMIGVCLAIVGWGMLQMGFGSRVNSAISVSGITAREAADAGIVHGLHEMNSRFVFGQAFSSSWLPFQSEPITLDNSGASYNYLIEGPFSGASDLYWLIRSTGTAGGQTRTVYAQTSLRNIFDYAIIVNERIVVHEGTRIDGYISNIGGVKYNYGATLPDGSVNAGGHVRIGTNSTLPRMIELKPGSFVNGDVLAGVGGELEGRDSVIYEGGGTGNPPIYGNKYNLSEPYVFQDIREMMPPMTENFGNFQDDDYVITVAPGAPRHIRFDSLTVDKNPDPNRIGSLTVVGPVEMYVEGDIWLKQGTAIFVGDPADPSTYGYSSLKVYLAGDLRQGQAAGINNLTEIPNNFWLFGVGTGPGYQDWDLNNAGAFFGAYYGPNARIISRAQGDIYGSVSGYSFDMRNAGFIHYDTALSQASLYDTGFGIDRWWEMVGP